MSHSDCTIRTLTSDDADRVDRLIAEMAIELGHRGVKRSTPENFRQALAGDPPLLTGVIAENAGRAIGLCLWFDWFSTWRGSLGLYVQDLYLTPTARGAGLGQAMLGEAIRRARQRGATFVRIGLDRRNDAGLALYGRLGFVARDEEIVLELRDGAFDAHAAPSNRRKRTSDQA